jgi:hypothetical protein
VFNCLICGSELKKRGNCDQYLYCENSCFYSHIKKSEVDWTFEEISIRIVKNGIVKYSVQYEVVDDTGSVKVTSHDNSKFGIIIDDIEETISKFIEFAIIERVLTS